MLISFRVDMPTANKNTDCNYTQGENCYLCNIGLVTPDGKGDVMRA